MFPFSMALGSSSHTKTVEKAGKTVLALQEKARKISTLQGYFQTTSSFKGVSKASGAFYALAPDNFRIDMKVILEDPRKGSSKIKSQIVSDGKTLWMKADNNNGKASPFIGMVDITKLQHEFPEAFPAGALSYTPWDELSELDTAGVRILGKAVLNGQSAVILESTFRKGLPALFSLSSAMIPARVRVWVGEKDGVTYQTIMFDRSGKKIAWISLSHVIRNSLLNQDLFRFALPEGVTAVDMTPMMEEELQGKSKEKLP